MGEDDYGWLLDYLGGGGDDPYANWGGGAGGDGSEIFGGDDPYANWGGGPGGDGSDGSGDFGGGLGSLFNGLGGAGSSLVNALTKGLGLTNSKGELDLSNLIPLLALLGGGINQANATRSAGHQIQDAANSANETAKGLMGGAMDNFKPYIAAGQTGLDRMLNAPASNLAGQFNQDKGSPSALGSKFYGAMTMNQLKR